MPESFFFRPATLLKKETLAQVFACEFCEISKDTFLQNTSGRLLLYKNLTVPISVLRCHRLMFSCCWFLVSFAQLELTPTTTSQKMRSVQCGANHIL